MLRPKDFPTTFKVDEPAPSIVSNANNSRRVPW
jgi:hypothetical protein